MPAVTDPGLAIRDDDFVHVGDAAELHKHLKDWADSLGMPVSTDIEYYDAEGFRLKRLTDGFDQVAGQPDPTDFDRLDLVDRIDRVHATLQVLANREIRNLEQTASTSQE